MDIPVGSVLSSKGGVEVGTTLKLEMLKDRAVFDNSFAELVRASLQACCTRNH
jgi:hypothetical protein